MIKANELRLGNYFEYLVEDKLSDPQSEWVLNVIDAQDIMQCDSINDYFNNHYRPIPITEKVLFQCGLYQIKGSKIYSINDAYKLKIIENNGFSSSCLLYKKYVGNLIVSITYVSYLHQLQNIYFALTGEELQYNP